MRAGDSRLCLLVFGVALFCLGEITCAGPGYAADKENEGRGTSPLSARGAKPLITSPGQKCYVSMTVENRSASAVSIPLPCVLNSAGDILSLKAAGKDGAETVSYPKTVNILPHSEYLPVITIRPRSTIVLSTWFIPWVSGTYNYEITLSNSAATRRVLKGTKAQGDVKTRSFGWSDESIPDVWTGKLAVKGKVVVGETLYGKKEAERFKELGAFDLKQVLNNLRNTALNETTPLRNRLSALSSLQEMRHQFATDTLIDIEQQSRMSPTIHHAVISALYKMALCGTGYKALPIFRTIALDPRAALPEKTLCVDALQTFAREAELRSGGRLVHVVTPEQKRFAKEALQEAE